jgi:hypothetical protein
VRPESFQALDLEDLQDPNLRHLSAENREDLSQGTELNEINPSKLREESLNSQKPEWFEPRDYPLKSDEGDPTNYQLEPTAIDRFRPDLGQGRVYRGDPMSTIGQQHLSHLREASLET